MGNNRERFISVTVSIMVFSADTTARSKTKEQRQVQGEMHLLESTLVLPVGCGCIILNYCGFSIQGTVTEFKSPSEFYIQMNSPRALEQMSKLSVKLQDCYANTVIQEQYIAIRGEVCVARNSVDKVRSD